MKSFWRACVGLCAFALVGCGAGVPTSKSGAAATSNLDGNWLLTGTLPFTGPSVSNPTFGIAVTFATVGSQIEGGVSHNFACGAFNTSSADGVVTGSADGNGAFSTTTSSSTAPVVVNTIAISGNVPASPNGSWAGKLTFSNNGSCPINQAVSFSAARIADVTGSYSGSTSLNINATHLVVQRAASTGSKCGTGFSGPFAIDRH